MKVSIIPKSVRLAAIGAVAASAVMVGGATGAQAATKDGVINTGEFVQWYYTGYSGGCEDDFGSDSSFYNDYFKNCGQGSSGVGARVANNTESYYNYDYTYSADVWTYQNYTGSRGHVAPRSGSSSYNSTFKNNVESLSWHL